MRQGEWFTFIKNSSSPVIVMHMAEDKAPHTEEQQTKPRGLRPWRSTRRQVLWAVGTLVALVTIALLVALLVVNLDAVKWEDLLSRERIKLVALFIGIAVALTTLFVLLAIGGASLGWTGFADKTLWEWLQLLGALAIPLVLALAGFWFTSQQEQSAQVVEEQRAQDAALQAYLDQMGTLLLTEELRKSKEFSEVRTLARARTLTVLERLDPKRRQAVMQFLIETALVQRVEKKAAPLIGLKDANLSDANLTGFPLMDADLNNADLSNANLHVSSMSHANLFQADLSDTNLRDADLSAADLSFANLSFANLRYANLSGKADIRSAHLFEADQSGADLIDADLTDQWADLSDANLRNADLRGADLSGADLSFANLRNADLSSANLSDANLIGADGVSKEMLEQQTKFLSNTTMPDGTVFFGEFEPALSLNLGGSVLGGSDWYVSAATPDSISISRIADYGLLLFTNSLQVFDPSKPSEPKELSEPENAKEWVAWFQSHPNLDTSKPLPVRVGGASGKQIDVTVPSTPENYTQDVCYGEPCVPRYRLSDENGIIGYEGYKDRFIIVDVGGETVLIDAAARAEKFDEFLPKMQKVLDSVEWKGG